MADLQVVVIEDEDDKKLSNIPSPTMRGGGRGSTLSESSKNSGSDSKIKRITKAISAETLATSMQELKANLDEVFTSIVEVGDFELSEVKLGLEINAKGGFALIGTAEAGAKGAITLTFVPPKKA